MMFNKIFRQLVLGTLFCGAMITQGHATPNVLVSVKPIHSLVSNLMDGVAEPTLLMGKKQSLHHYSIRPSERRLIENADLIIWVGPELESSLSAIMENIDDDKEVITLMKNKNIEKLSLTQISNDQQATTYDPHIWLSTQNAVEIVKEVNDALARIDPEHATVYETNAYKLTFRIIILKKQIENLLRVAGRPYVSHHEALRYFSEEMELKSIGSIFRTPEIQPSAARLKKLIEKIKREDVRCLLYDIAEPSSHIKSLSKQTKVKPVSYDASGFKVTAGKEAWFNIMLNMTKKIAPCLISR